MRVFAGSLAAGNSIIGVDNAGNYSSFAVGNISPASGGYGFATSGTNPNWTTVRDNSSGGFADTFVGGVAASFANINSGNGNSFAMYGGSQAFNGVEARRNLPINLSVGFALSGEMAVRFRDGNKGISVYSDTSFSNQGFNVNIGGGGTGTYSVQGTNVGSPPDGSGDVNYADDQRIRVVLKQITATTYDYAVTFNTGTTKTGTVTTNGIVRGFKFYCYGTNGGDGNNFYFNNLKIYRF